MPKLAVLFLAVLVFSPVVILARDFRDIRHDSYEIAEGSGLEIRSNPEGMDVHIDGVFRGRTPFIDRNIPPGQYNVRLSGDDHDERHFTATVYSDSRHIISVRMEEKLGFLLVIIKRTDGSPENLPFKPHILANSAEIILPDTADANQIILRLPVGYNRIWARAFGWEDTSVSALVSRNFQASVEIEMRPSVFRMSNFTQSRRRFNPLNAGNLGTNVYLFSVSAPSSGLVTITDQKGERVFYKELERFDTWNQSVAWNGRDLEGGPLPQGVYTVLIEANDLSLEIETEINYSLNIFPLSMDGVVSGTALAPLPHVLPAGSFQIGAGIIYDVNGLPFKINARVSPFNRLELSASFNINPNFHSDLGWGGAGSFKVNILDGRENYEKAALVFSLALSGAWAIADGEYPLSGGKGAGFYAPLSLDLKDAFSGRFVFSICPSVFWRGGNSAPEFFLSAGVLYLGDWFTAEISARGEFEFSDGRQRYLSGIQGRFFPAPSNLYYSAQGGVIFSENVSGYGGVGIGLIY